MLVYNQDIEVLMQLIKEHTELLKQPFDYATKRALLEHLISSPNALVVAWEDQGYLVGMIVKHPFHDISMAFELGVYCKAKGKGKELIKAYEDWARSKRITKVTLTSDLVNDVGNYYKRLGYTATETTYTKDLD
jgi:GNAT superfamily N-acetyltransferase